MSQFDGLDNPAFLYIRTYPVSSFWLFEQCSNSTRTRTCTQLGPSLVIVISLAPILPISPCSDNLAMFYVYNFRIH
ncbi:hypothetical protein L211DRAFT_843144 [Terfezia boudieri ATCC MYA-4762]|uniref:Uncharacterized protein n=1 Tax=Terfezia boudieri ATCC MYA-4762 TaxID=1051890 RepID=A0A3N4L818_9PEZI|nr:hypothetical protein L211DRAFT_843144 [Terfezia boudieri ATCC MYA-4762]